MLFLYLHKLYFSNCAYKSFLVKNETCMKKLILLTLINVLFLGSKAQVVINEICPSNTSQLEDNYGEFSDWVELYNKGNNIVNLKDYALSDNVLISDMWKFPNVSIGAGEYLMVYLSGKNTVDAINHWESPVLESNLWKYIVPDKNTSNNWKNLTFDDSSWLSGPGGIGFGDDDDATVLPEIVGAVFMRTNFHLFDTSLVQMGFFHMDYDDGFVAYLNGVEIARKNMSGTNYNDYATTYHEAVMYEGGKPTAFELDSKTIRSLLVTGNNVLAIQVHNTDDLSSDLTSRPFLTLGMKTAETFWDPAPSFFEAPDIGAYYHANFSLANGVEPLVLFNPSGTPIDGVNPPRILTNATYGRQTDGANTFKIFKPGTPGVSNVGGVSYNGITTDKVIFSKPAGFYSEAQSINLSTTNSGATIRYTKDGSKPTASSTIYSGTITVSKTQVIRAAVFVTGNLTEFYETNTYIIGDSENPKLPVMSISANPDDFFDKNTGIYVKGPNASGVAPNYGANFWENWEREIHFEYFDKNDQLGIEQDCGVKIFGGWSRDQPMKSLRLLSRDEYGGKDFKYKFFESKNINSFRQLVLRNSGNDFNNLHFRDALNHETIKDVGNQDIMAYQPVVVFINGEYWGIHNLRERMGDHYVEENHGVDNKEINIIENNGIGLEIAKNGTDTDWKNTVDFILNSDLTIPSNWNQVKNMIDVPNFIDFFASETYHINWDAPHNNVRLWRPKDNSKGWRYLYFDTDFGLNLFGLSYTGASYNELNRFIEDDRSSHSPVFKKLLTNPDFKCQFITRYADLMNTVYAPANYKGVVDSIKTLINDDMGKHFDRWGSSYISWNGQINSVKSFIDSRREKVRGHISTTITGAGTLGDLLVDVNPAGSGRVLINTVTPSQYSWSGSYYSGCPVELSVVPAIGYKFDNWSGANTSSTKKISLSVSSDKSVVANFSVDSNTPKITFSEINYNSPSEKNPGDWIELFNFGSSATDLSGWKIKDGNDYNEFVIPNGTILEKNNYLVISNDLDKFNSIYPTVTNVIGPLTFKFSNSGEEIRLFDEFNRLRLTVTYDNNLPWSKLADGKGGTLELLNPQASLNDPNNWFGGCLGGSPGGKYVECPCENPFLGAQAFLCENGGSVVLDAGLNQENKNFTWYLNGDKLPETSSTVTAVNEGVYSVITQSLTCLRESSINVFSNFSFNLGADFELCTPAERELTSGTAISNVNYTWFRNATDLNSNTNSLKVTSPGIYKLNAKLGSCATVSDQVVVTSLNPTPVDVKACNGEAVTLSVEGTNTYKWYSKPTGGSSLKTGKSYTTTLDKTTTFYVENASATGANHYNAGPVDTTFGATWGHENFKDYQLRFEVFKTCYLNFITVYPRGSSSITINITPNGGTKKTFTVPALTSGSTQRIYLGYKLTANKYSIDAIGTDGKLRMNNENSNFPYKDGNGYISIYRTEPEWAGATNKWYFFFYNFELSDAIYVPVCDRTPVTAYLCERPEVTIYASKTDIVSGERIDFDADVEGTYTGVNWDFGVGASPRYASGVGPHNVLFGSRGEYEVKLTVSNNAENHSFTKSINVCAKPDVVSLISEKTDFCGIPFLITSDYLVGYTYQWYLNGNTLENNTINKYAIDIEKFGNYSVQITDPINASLCATTSKTVKITDCVLSTTDFDQKTTVGLYPNPAFDKIFVSGVEGDILIKDIRGAVLIKSTTADSSVDVSSLAAGVYIVTIKNELSEYSIRLIKD